MAIQKQSVAEEPPYFALVNSESHLSFGIRIPRLVAAVVVHSV